MGGPGEVTLAETRVFAGPSQGRLRIWGVGYEVDVSKRGGGIGASSGATVLGLILRSRTVPTVQMPSGSCVELCRTVQNTMTPETATWAIAMQYDEGGAQDVDQLVAKRVIRIAGPSNSPLPATGTTLEVEVYGFGVALS